MTLQAIHDLTKARMENGGTIERDVRAARSLVAGPVRGIEIGEARHGGFDRSNSYWQEDKA
jgi:hypothetical protein